MSSKQHFMKNFDPWRHARPVAAVAVLLILYGLTRLPSLGDQQRASLAGRFRFVEIPLPEGPVTQSIRAVHPSLERFAGWISAVGAAVALSDLDGDGLANDVCHVDPQNDQVRVFPVPGTGPRYEPFVLDPAPLAYDPGTMAPMGCLPGDVNEDGLMDIVVYYWGRTPLALLRQGERRATPGSTRLARERYTAVELVAGDRSAPGQERWYSNAATLADIDGDGHLDLLVGNYFQDSARILDAGASGMEAMQHSMSRARNGGMNRLLLWQDAHAGASPNVVFHDVQGAFAGDLGRGWTLAMGAADLDGDLLPEIYVANDFGPDTLFHNRSRPGHPLLVPLQGKRTITTPSSKILGRDSFKGMGVDFADMNGDGFLDIYVSNIAAEYALEESHFLWLSTGDVAAMNDGISPYVDAGEELGLSRSEWSWDARLADFDNDGVVEAVQATGFAKGATDRWPELHELAMGNDELLADPRVWPRLGVDDDLSGHVHNPFFVRDPGSGRYFDIAGDIGLDRPMVTRGIAIADVDGDGDLDMAVANQWETSYLYRNDAPAPGAFLGLHLVLAVDSSDVPGGAPGGNRLVVRAGHPGASTPVRPAVGAVITVRTPDGRSHVAQVDGGTGHSGKRSHDIHLGLGNLPSDARIEVTLCWRSAGRVERESIILTPGWHTVIVPAAPVRSAQRKPWRPH